MWKEEMEILESILVMDINGGDYERIVKIKDKLISSLSFLF